MALDWCLDQRFNVSTFLSHYDLYRFWKMGFCFEEWLLLKRMTYFITEWKIISTHDVNLWEKEILATCDFHTSYLHTFGFATFSRHQSIWLFTYFELKSFPFQFLMHYSCIIHVHISFAIVPFIIQINRSDVVRQLACSVIHVCYK